MGGKGSGTWYRWDKQTTLEETRRIEIAYLKKRGFLKSGVAGTLSWHCGDRSTGTINFQSYTNRLVLNYRVLAYENEWKPVSQTIYFDSTPCNFGGARKWFICPRCSKRVGVLSGYGKYFFCRHCYNLPYGSQREGKVDRLIRAREKLEKKIFDETGYRKRKGMHQATFDRLYFKYQWLDIYIDDLTIRRLSRKFCLTNPISF